MTRMTQSRRGFLIAALTAMPLAGCGSILPGGGDAPRLYILSPCTAFPPELPSRRWHLAIAQPFAPAEIDTARIALRRGALTIEYFADSAWPDRAPAMLQTLLVESFENSGRIAAVSREQQGLSADYLLYTDLERFDAVYEHPGEPPTVLVRIHVRLARSDRAIPIGTRLERKEAAQRNDIESTVAAFDRAFGAVTRDIIAWTLNEGEKGG